MARSEDMLFSPTKWTVVASGVNSTVTASRSATAGKSHYIVAISISGSGQPSAPVTAQVRANSGGTILDQFEIPAQPFAPIVINYVRPLRVAEGQQCDVNLPALGPGITGTVTLRGFTT